MMSNRKAFVTRYTIDETVEKGSLTYMLSSEGNEEYYVKHRSKVRKDVHARLLVNFGRYEQAEGGMNHTAVIIVDPAGSVPEFFKK